MIFATWNINSLRVRLAHVQRWIAANQPDVLCLQETKVQDQDFPVSQFEDMGYSVIYAGQKTYNGVAIVSRESALEAVTALPTMDDSQKRLIAATFAGVRVVNVYVPNGSEVGSDKYRYKLSWLESLREFVAAELERKNRLLLLGDFNIAPEDRDVYDPELWEGAVLVSDKERREFQALVDMGLVDLFRRYEQSEGQFSWWDYRAAAFRRNQGLRIDHILCSLPLAEHCRTCVIDQEPRGWERPSDHAPVVAEFNIS